MSSTSYAVAWAYTTTNTSISGYYGNFKCNQKNTTSLKYTKEDCSVTIIIIGY